MATWFDRWRGEGQGRCAPATLAPTAGDRCFVLGGDALTVPATLQAGSYTEVAQAVDLTGYDVVAADLQTIGVPAASFVTPDRLPWVSGETITLWPLAEAAGLALPDVSGPQLAPQGDLAVGTEAYSTTGRPCRTFPTAGATAYLAGTNTPRGWSADLSAYTFECWLLFRPRDYADSTGINLDLYRCETAGGGGLRIYLAGVGGGLSWLLTVDHTVGGVTQTQTCPTYAWAANDGWHHVALVYDGTAIGAAQLALYIDGLAASAGAGAVGGDAGAPALSEALTVGHPGLWGALSQVRLSGIPFDAARVAADYLLCTAAPVTQLARWRMALRIDGVEYCARTLRATEARSLADFRAPVRHLSGAHTVAFRLTLEAV